MTVLTILAVIGLPIVATLAWSYEITPGGIVLDDGAPDGVKLPRARRAVAPAIVAGVALMAVVTGVAWWRSIEMGGTEASPQVDATHPSVAVLPLVDMSPSGGNSYLGDGLSEELSMRLAQVPGLRVAARTSAFEFKDRNVDVRRIGQSLGVRHVLEGSVRRDGDNLRVTMQLIDSANGYHVWAGSYDRSWSDVISIQDEIARSVTEALRIVLVPAEASPASRVGRDARRPGRRSVSRRARDAAAVRRHEPPDGGGEALRRGDRDRADRSRAPTPGCAGSVCGSTTAPVIPPTSHRAEQSCRRALDLDASLVETEKALGEPLPVQRPDRRFRGDLPDARDPNPRGCGRAYRSRAGTMPPAGGSRPPSAASGRRCRSSPRSGARSMRSAGSCSRAAGSTRPSTPIARSASWRRRARAPTTTSAPRCR